MAIKILAPYIRQDAPITQTFEQHRSRARARGWCSEPPCGGKVQYYGGLDVGIAYESLRAPISGRVYTHRGSAGYGNYVRIDALIEGHAVNVILAHLSEIAVNTGDLLSVGDPVGVSGNSGNSTGPHLHLELRVDGTPVDPAPRLVWDPLDVTIGEPRPLAGDAWRNVSLPSNLLKARVIAHPFLYLRSAPRTTGVILGHITPGEEVEVLEIIRESGESGDVWVRCGYEQYCAAVYRGVVLLEPMSPG